MTAAAVNVVRADGQSCIQGNWTSQPPLHGKVAHAPALCNTCVTKCPFLLDAVAYHIVQYDSAGYIATYSLCI